MEGDEKAEQSLAALLDEIERGDELVRPEAARLLAQRDDKDAALVAIALLRTAENQDVRKWAAYALGFIGQKRAKKPLIAALLDRQNDLDVRCHAAEALGHLLELTGPHEDAAAALHTVIEDEGPELRFWAAFALGSIGSEKDIPVLERLAATDDRIVDGWWAVSKEALDAVECIRDRIAQ